MQLDRLPPRIGGGSVAFNYDKLVDLLLVRAPDGRLGFYPWGTRLRGYWVDSDTREATLRTVTRQFYRILRIALPTIFIGTMALNSLAPRVFTWPFLLLAIMSVCLPWLRTMSRLTKGLDRAPGPSRSATARPFLERVAALMSYRRLAASLGFFVILGVLTVKGDRQTQIDWRQLLVELVSALASAYLLMVLSVKIWKRIPTSAPTLQQQFNTLAWRPVWIVLGCLFVASLVLAYYVAMHNK